MANHQVAITGRSQCPAFDMKNMTFEEYLFDLELWASNCGLPKGKIVSDIFLSLPVTDSSNIRRILRQNCLMMRCAAMEGSRKSWIR